MRVGDLVKWSDPGKDAVGIVMEEPNESYGSVARIGVSFFSDRGCQVQYPRIEQIELVEPRKIDENR